VFAGKLGLLSELGVVLLQSDHLSGVRRERRFSLKLGNLAIDLAFQGKELGLERCDRRRALLEFLGLSDSAELSARREQTTKASILLASLKSFGGCSSAACAALPLQKALFASSFSA